VTIDISSTLLFKKSETNLSPYVCSFSPAL
jgi:hypothetical protein